MVIRRAGDPDSKSVPSSPANDSVDRERVGH
jgi:hypothetical protein